MSGKQPKQNSHTTAAIVNFTQNFASVQHPTASLLHRQPGRSVRHNLLRLNSPEPTHDFRTSILLGGNHPQNQFRHLLTKKQRTEEAKKEAEERERERIRRADSISEAPRPASSLAGGLGGSTTSAFGANGSHNASQNNSRPGTSGDPWSGPDDLAAYFAEGGPDRRKSLMAGVERMQKASQASQRSSSQNGGMGGGGSRPASSNDGLTAPPPATFNDRSKTSHGGSRPPLTGSNSASVGGGVKGVRGLQSRQAATAPNGMGRAMTPQPMAGGRASTAAAAAAAAGTPPRSPENSNNVSGYLLAKQQTDFIKKNIEVAFQRPMTQQATKSAMARFEEKWQSKQKENSGSFGDFSLQINGDYETPFVAQLPEIDKPSWTSKELTRFEKRQKGPRTLTTMPATQFSPPKVIVMMFRFSNVRNLRVTKSLRKVGYPELHEQFSTTSKSGTISKVQFQQVCAKYLSAVDRLECLRILECFDRNQLGDVDLNMLLIGLQILLECAAPGDAMRFCFTLMDTANKIPRYITRYEVQTLVSYASAFAADASDNMDAEYLMMAKSIEELLVSHKDPKPGQEGHNPANTTTSAGAPSVTPRTSPGKPPMSPGANTTDSEHQPPEAMSASAIRATQRYDYMGRMPLKEFLDDLDQKMEQKRQEAKRNNKKKQAAQLRLNQNARGSGHTPEKGGEGGDADGDGEKRQSQFMFGKAWSQGGAVTAVHRMSSKKMIINTLMAEHPPQ